MENLPKSGAYLIALALMMAFSACATPTTPRIVASTPTPIAVFGITQTGTVSNARYVFCQEDTCPVPTLKRTAQEFRTQSLSTSPTLAFDAISSDTNQALMPTPRPQPSTRQAAKSVRTAARHVQRLTQNPQRARSKTSRCAHPTQRPQQHVGPAVTGNVQQTLPQQATSTAVPDSSPPPTDVTTKGISK